MSNDIRELESDELENVAGGKPESPPVDQDQSGQNGKLRSIIWGA
jgi:hypothetical protein